MPAPTRSADLAPIFWRWRTGPPWRSRRTAVRGIEQGARQSDALARIAATLSFDRPLQSVLDALAEDVVVGRAPSRAR
jgi:hypothetical protein